MPKLKLPKFIPQFTKPRYTPSQTPILWVLSDRIPRCKQAIIEDRIAITNGINLWIAKIDDEELQIVDGLHNKAECYRLGAKYLRTGEI